MQLDILKYEFSTENKEVNSVSARDLHRELEVKTDFSDWVKNRIAKYEFIEGVDFIIAPEKKGTLKSTTYGKIKLTIASQ